MKLGEDLVTRKQLYEWARGKNETGGMKCSPTLTRAVAKFARVPREGAAVRARWRVVL